MKTGLLALLIGLGYILLNDILLYATLRRMRRSRAFRIGYWTHTFLFLVGLVGVSWLMLRIKQPEIYLWIGRGTALLFLCYVPKTVYLLFHVLALGFKRASWVGLARWVNRFAGLSAGCFFLIILFGVTVGRYDFVVTRQTVRIPDLPPAFQHFRIVQLTDLHLGSHGKTYPGIRKLVEEVNALQPDLLVFTGDMVNNFASEIEPWKTLLHQLHAPHGKYAVTGNHDYGHYVKWPSRDAWKINMQQFFRHMEEMGFSLLNNRNIPLVVSGDTLYLCGVENWGKPPFPRYGKLEEALQGTAGKPVVLLSHDPSHWHEQVRHYPVALTLSGHTHAMQMGFRIGEYQWSPSRYIYPEYNGLYGPTGHHLYVSRGVGYIGFPGRVGLRPEITVIELVNATSR